MRHKYVKYYIGKIYLDTEDSYLDIKDFPLDIGSCLAAEGYFIANNRIQTGYKELAEMGVDGRWMNAFKFISNPSRSGGFIVEYNREVFLGGGNELLFFLDTDVYDAGVDVREVLKTQDPRGCIPIEVAKSYDQKMFEELPEQLQGGFLRKLKKPLEVPAQVLLDNTYDKYVTRGLPFQIFESKESDHCFNLSTNTIEHKQL